MFIPNTNSAVRGTFSLVVSSPPYTLNCIKNCHSIHCNKILQLDALPKPTCNSQGKPGVFAKTPSHQIIEILKHSTKHLYNLLYIHHQGRAYFCRAAHTRPIVRVSLAALALPLVTTGTYICKTYALS